MNDYEMSLALDRFELLASSDDVKTDLELTCTECGALICDAESGDTLGVLLRTAQGHECSDDDD